MLKRKNASVLLFTLLILSLITLLTQQLMRSIWIGVNFDNRIVLSQKARSLALGGINLAISQLTERQESKKSIGSEKEDPEKIFKDFLSRVLPNLNRWQTFDLDKKIDGTDGQIKICITCENGKLNLNEGFDFEKQEFKKEYNDLLKGLYIKKKFAEGEILKKLTDFFKERKKKLDDISELVEIEGFENLNVFYEPPKLPEAKKNIQPNESIFLQDLFTTWSLDDKVELLFASDSLCAILNLRRPLAADSEKLKAKFKALIDTYKKDFGADWEKNWNNLQPVYGAKPKTLSVFNKIFSKEFGPQVYSVLSCGNVGGVEQKVLAVIKVLEEKKDNNKKEETSQKAATEQSSEKKETAKKNLKLVRMYWI